MIHTILVAIATIFLGLTLLFIFFRRPILAYLIQSHSNDGKPLVILYTSRLSPFGMKLEYAFKALGVRFLNNFDIQSYLLFFSIELAVLLARRYHVGLENPPKEGMGELPLVPFVITPSGRVWYDSSHIIHELLRTPGRLGSDQLTKQPEAATRPSQQVAFIAGFLDEFFDEFGLYLVHFERWTNPANFLETTPGDFLSKQEIFNSSARPLLCGLCPLALQNYVAKGFNVRQTKRLAYLFAVAPEGTQAVRAEGFPAPPQSGPPTWSLLRESYDELLQVLESIFAKRDRLLPSASQWTIADASCFGQLNINAFMESGFRKFALKVAPNTLAWLDAIERNQFKFPVSTEDTTSDLKQDEGVQALMRLALRTFVPIMQQNEQAYQRVLADSLPRVFNEEAFDKGLSMYNGVVAGHAFRSVVKSFQVEVWRKLKSRWIHDLQEQDRIELSQAFEGLDEAMVEQSVHL